MLVTEFDYTSIQVYAGNVYANGERKNFWQLLLGRAQEVAILDEKPGIGNAGLAWLSADLSPLSSSCFNLHQKLLPCVAYPSSTSQESPNNSSITLPSLIRHWDVVFGGSDDVVAILCPDYWPISHSWQFSPSRRSRFETERRPRHPKPSEG